MKKTKYKIDRRERNRTRTRLFASDPERKAIYERNIALSKPAIDELVQVDYEIEDLDDLKYSVWSLDRLRHPEAETTAIDLLDDEDVRLHAIIALGKMKSKRAVSKIETFSTSKAPGIGREARRAITKIMRQSATGRPC
jgi:HEAT repeat protein